MEDAIIDSPKPPSVDITHRKEFMDSTELYIKMCEEAEEIQRMPQDWDYGYDIETEECSVRVSDEFQQLIKKEYGVPIIDEGYYESWVWLPQQDQLQRMVSNRVFGSAVELARWFGSWTDTLFQEFPYESMEQLWLAFVMKEKYNKVWDGESWV